MRISDWSSDVCSSDLPPAGFAAIRAEPWDPQQRHEAGAANFHAVMMFGGPPPATAYFDGGILNFVFAEMWMRPGLDQRARRWITLIGVSESRSEEHTSELQSLMRISYAVFCLKKKTP